MNMFDQSKLYDLSELISHSVNEVCEMALLQRDYSGFESYDDFKLLGIRKLMLESEALSFRSSVFLVKEKEVFFYQFENKKFTRFANSFTGMLHSLEEIYGDNRRIIDSYANAIESLEEQLFSRNISGVFLDMWFDLKRDLSRVENYYFRNSAVYHEFYKKTEPALGDLTDEFRDIAEGIQFQNNTIVSLSNRLASIHSYYNSIKAERLNKTLLMLTVISGIFLPLNLIVGFFGMNTDGMFFHGEPKATERVLLILAGVFVVAFLGIRIVRLVDHYLLKFLLGRYNFYKNLTKRLDEIDERLKGH